MERKKEISWLPDELEFGQPYFFLRGKREIFLQNVHRITAYSDTYIKLQGKKTDVSIYGKKLSIEYYRGDEIKITGKIEKIELE